MLTGSHLFESPDQELTEKLKGFSVYSSSDKDNSYKRGYYNGSNSTVQLIYKKKPLRQLTFKNTETAKDFYKKFAKINQTPTDEKEKIFTEIEGS